MSLDVINVIIIRISVDTRRGPFLVFHSAFSIFKISYSYNPSVTIQKRQYVIKIQHWHHHHHHVVHRRKKSRCPSLSLKLGQLLWMESTRLERFFDFVVCYQLHDRRRRGLVRYSLRRGGWTFHWEHCSWCWSRRRNWIFLFFASHNCPPYNKGHCPIHPWTPPQLYFHHTS